MKFRPIPVFLALFCLIAPVLPARAFLDNTVRVDKFKWQHAQTDHFDIYYDKKDQRHIPRLAHHLENAWKKVGQRLNFYVPGRTPFFFYGDHNQFEQTNIVKIDEGTGGVTEAFKNRLLIFNDGSETWLEHVIYHEFSHVVQFNILYGGFWKSVRLLKSPFYALWFMEGMAEYGSGDVDEAVSDMVVRDAVYTKTLVGLPELQGFAHLKPNQVTLGYKTGETTMRFLVDEYGEDKVGKFLVTMENHFDVSSALQELLGTDLERFNLRFHEWLEEKYMDLFARAKEPTFYGTKLTASSEIPQFNEAPAVSPDGKTIYYFSDKDGPTRLYELDVASHKIRLLINTRWGRFENVHTEGRGLSLSRDGRWLAFSGEKTQQDYLYLFDLQKRRLKRVRVPVDEIRSPVFSPTDDTLVLVGMTDGYNDLYIVTPDGAIVKRLTNNPQDERDPVFRPDGRSVVYSGEVMSADGEEAMYRDLFEVSVDSGEPHRIIALPGEERDPEVLPDGTLLFVRDRNDAGELGFNFWRLKPGAAEPERVTDLIGGAFSPRYCTQTGQLYFVAFYRGEKQIYQFSNPTALMTAEKIPEKPQPKKSQPEFVDVNEGAVANAEAKEMTQAMNTWSDGLSSPLIHGQIKPYKLRASTDLFLPFFFYSSIDGFVVADVWQFSDLLGNHQFQQQMQFSSGNSFHDLAVFYTYARWRPSFTLGVRSFEYFVNFDDTQQRRENDYVAFAAYPLDRINSLNLGVGSTYRYDAFLDESQLNIDFQDRFWFAQYIHDTVTGHYLVPTQGQRLSLFYQQGVNRLSGNQDYKSGGLSAAQYIQLPRESTLAGRVFYARSVGAQAQVFRLGGIDRVRALTDSLSNQKTNVVVTSAELRFRLKYLNTRTSFIYPDFFFKAAYLTLFDDLGYGWDSADERDNLRTHNAQNSTGVGVVWPTFIIQSFKLDFGIQWARRTTDGTQVWYITVGPSF